MSDPRLGHRLFMLGFIAAPFVVLAILIYGILISFEKGPSMVAEPVGAGAGDSGGANAIGQALFGTGDQGRQIPAEQTARGAMLVVRDASGLAGDGRPVLVLSNHGGWDVSRALAMELQESGAWEIRLPGPMPGETEPLAFRFAVAGEGGEVMFATDEAGEAIGERRLPRVKEADAVGDEPLVYRFVVTGFGGG